MRRYYDRVIEAGLSVNSSGGSDNAGRRIHIVPVHPHFEFSDVVRTRPEPLLVGMHSHLDLDKTWFLFQVQWADTAEFDSAAIAVACFYEGSIHQFVGLEMGLNNVLDGEEAGFGDWGIDMLADDR